jgi:HPt (histidine-containing phosphotransfer) domain-containing protein
MAILKVLLVENDASRAARIAASLSAGNLDVVTVATSEDAKSALALRQFDVLLLTSTVDGSRPLVTLRERSVATTVLIVWGDHPDAGEALTIPATVPEQDLALEILRVHQDADLRRDAASDALPVFDKAEFRNQMGGDEALIHEIVGLFFEDSISQLQTIRTMLEGGDNQNASRLAHSLKGALGSLRAPRAHHCAAILEKAASTGDAPRSQHAFAALEKSMDELALELRAILGA